MCADGRALMSLFDTPCRRILTAQSVFGRKTEACVSLHIGTALAIDQSPAAEVTMWNWLTCHVSARHEYGVSCERGAIFLRCLHCGCRSAGWSVDARTATTERVAAQTRTEPIVTSPRTAAMCAGRPGLRAPEGPAATVARVPNRAELTTEVAAAAQSRLEAGVVHRFEPRAKSRASAAARPSQAAAPPVTSAAPARILPFQSRARRERPAA